MPKTTFPGVPSAGVTGGRPPVWGDRRSAVIDGAGFIGSHFVHNLLADPAVESVAVYDNFSSGSEAPLKDVMNDARLLIVRGDVGDLENLKPAIVRLNPDRIRNPGWANAWNSGQALERSKLAMVGEVLAEGVGAVRL